LGRIPNDSLQFLLDETVRLIQAEFPPTLCFGQTVALDTKPLSLHFKNLI